MKKNIIVTGAGGFIGSWVVRKLYKKYKVIAVVSPFSKLLRLVDIKKNVAVVKANLADSKKVDKLIKRYRPSAVIHLATHGVYPYQQKDEDRIVIDNYLMTCNLLTSSVKFGVEKFINTGSVFEYGSQTRKVSEDDVDLGDVLNKYSAVKMATTSLVNAYSDVLKVITLRPFTTYGPYEDSSRFVRASIERALKNEPIRIVKNVFRDFVYVEDVANAYTKALLVNYSSGEILNIASGKKLSLEQVSNLIKKSTRSKSDIIFDKLYVRKKESACWANINKARRILNWIPKTSIDVGINKTIDSIKKV